MNTDSSLSLKDKTTNLFFTNIFIIPSYESSHTIYYQKEISALTFGDYCMNEIYIRIY